MRTPTSGEFKAFLDADKTDGTWKLDHTSGHGHYEKTLADLTVLRTHHSWGKSASLHPDVFQEICKVQLRVTSQQFWDTIRLGKSQRPATAAAPEEPDRMNLRTYQELRRKLHYTEEQLEEMTGTEAKRILAKFYGRK